MIKNNNLKEELEKLCEPVYVFLNNHYDPHTTIEISFNRITIKREEIGISKIKRIEG